MCVCVCLGGGCWSRVLKMQWNNKCIFICLAAARCSSVWSKSTLHFSIGKNGAPMRMQSHIQHEYYTGFFTKRAKLENWIKTNAMRDRHTFSTLLDGKRLKVQLVCIQHEQLVLSNKYWNNILHLNHMICGYWHQGVKNSIS